jgi:hypothetical protein
VALRSIWTRLGAVRSVPIPVQRTETRCPARRDSRPCDRDRGSPPVGRPISLSHDGDPARGFPGNGIAPRRLEDESVRGRLEGTRRDCLAAARAGERTRRANTIDAPTRLVPSMPNVSLYPLFASFLLFFCRRGLQSETGSWTITQQQLRLRPPGREDVLAPRALSHLEEEAPPRDCARGGAIASTTRSPTAAKATKTEVMRTAESTGA